MYSNFEDNDVRKVPKQQVNFSPFHIEQASEQHSHSVKGV